VIVAYVTAVPGVAPACLIGNEASGLLIATQPRKQLVYDDKDANYDTHCEDKANRGRHSSL
jgi:hypothetical protein